MKRCGFCSFASDDELAFRAHLVAAHGWGVPQPGPSLARDSLTYLLGRLDGFERDGTLDTQSATRLRAVLRRDLGGDAPPRAVATPVVRAVPGVATPAVAAPSRAPGVDLFTPERAPSLLLYVGAFLLVVAAFIFVSVSGDQLSDLVKLVLMLAGTAAFVAAGVVCHRIPRVEEAGRTFLVIGAIVAALDVVATYALVLRTPPFDSPTLWIVGSLACAVLYGLLAIVGYGRAYAYLMLGATSSALLGALALVDARIAWWPVPYALLALALDVLADVARGRVVRIARPLAPLARVMLPSALALTVAAVGANERDRWSVVAATAVAGAYYLRRIPRAVIWERWLAVAAPGALGCATLWALGSRGNTFGVASVVVAACYAVVAVPPRLVPLAVPAWLRRIALAYAYAAAVFAILPLESYWRATASGALGCLGAALVLASLAFARRSHLPFTEARAATLGAVIAAHLGWYFLLAWLGVLRAGVALFSGPTPRELALAFAALPLVAVALAIAARRDAPALVAPLAGAAIASAALVSLWSYGDPALQSALPAGYAAVIVAAAIAARRYEGLWIALAFAGMFGWGLWRWIHPSDGATVLVPSAVGVLLFALGGRLASRDARLAQTLRPIAATIAGAAVFAGFVLSRGPDSDAWLATIPALVVLGSLAAMECALRRMDRGVAASSAAYFVAVLMSVARAHPTDIEAYTIPAAIYLAAVAFWMARSSDAPLRALAGATWAAAAIVVALPSLILASTETTIGGFGHTAPWRYPLGLAVSLAAVRFAATRGLQAPGRAGIALLWIGGVVAFISASRFEGVAALMGAVAIALALEATRSVAWRLGADALVALELAGAFLVLGPELPLLGLTQGQSHPLLFAMEALVIYAAAALRARTALSAAALASLGLFLVASLGSRGTQSDAIVAGAATIVVVLALLRYRALRLPERHILLAELCGLALFLLPTVRVSWSEPFFPQTPLLFAQIFAVLAVGILLRRRWLVAGALGVIGVEAVRATVELVDRLPNWVLFGASGIALLTIGFVLLLRKEWWRMWSTRAFEWWARL